MTLVRPAAGGASPAARSSAARQIGEIGCCHKPQIPALLRRLQPYLYSPKWETRIAAGEAVAALADLAPHARASHRADSPADAGRKAVDDGLLTFAVFNVSRVRTSSSGAPRGVATGLTDSLQQSRKQNAGPTSMSQIHGRTPAGAGTRRAALRIGCGGV